MALASGTQQAGDELHSVLPQALALDGFDEKLTYPAAMMAGRGTPSLAARSFPPVRPYRTTPTPSKAKPTIPARTADARMVSKGWRILTGEKIP
jgi:hypothetical protein